MQLEEREREIAEREKQIGTSKPYRKAISQLRKQHFDKISRRRLHIAAQFAQANAQANSPSPPGSPMKTSMYVQLDGNQTKSVIQAPIGFCAKKKTRHRRVGSGGSMNVKTNINRDRKQHESESRIASLVDTHTQTDVKDLTKTGETDGVNSSPKHLEPAVKNCVASEDSSNESDIDDNVPQEDTTSSSQNNNNQAMANSMATSIMTGSNLSYDTEDLCDKLRVTSDDDNLESLRRKVNELIIEATNSSIDSYSTNSSTNTIINKKIHMKIFEKSDDFSCVDMPNCGFVDNNKNIKNIQCSCVDDVDNCCEDDARSCSDDDFNGAKKFNYSLRMKRYACIILA